MVSVFNILYYLSLPVHVHRLLGVLKRLAGPAHPQVTLTPDYERGDVLEIQHDRAVEEVEGHVRTAAPDTELGCDACLNSKLMFSLHFNICKNRDEKLH